LLGGSKYAAESCLLSDVAVVVISSQISVGTVDELTRARKWQLKKVF